MGRRGWVLAIGVAIAAWATSASRSVALATGAVVATAFSAAAAPLGTSRHRQHEMEGRPSRPASAPPHRLGGRLEGWAGCRDRGGGAGARVSMIAGLCSRFHQATSTRARQREPHLYAC